MMFRSAQHGAMQAFSFGKSKARLVNSDAEGKKIFFKDVAGLKEVKEEIQEVVEFLKDSKKFEKVGARIPKGVLLIGPPGTGKTLLAKAVANEAGVPFFYVSGSEFVELFVGVGANRVRDTFETAKKHSPAVVFIDELDAIGRARSFSSMGGQESDQTLNALLVEMDGLQGRQENVVVIGATNAAEGVLDQALLRPGRFDRKIYVDRPNLEGREKVFKFYLSKVQVDPGVDAGRLARISVGKTPAEIENIVKEAALIATREKRDAVSYKDISAAIERVDLGVKHRKSMSEQERRPRYVTLKSIDLSLQLDSRNFCASSLVFAYSVFGCNGEFSLTVLLPGSPKAPRPDTYTKNFVFSFTRLNKFTEPS
jgi:cell division protease FtsH